MFTVNVLHIKNVYFHLVINTLDKEIRIQKKNIVISETLYLIHQNVYISDEFNWFNSDHFF